MTSDPDQPQAPSADGHRRVIAELNELAAQVAATIQKFEAAGMTSFMKDDYVALHRLEARIMAMRDEHIRALASSSSTAAQSPSAESE